MPVVAEIRENLRLALPIVATQIGLMAMGLVDTAFVGRVGEQALASVSLGNNVVFGTSMFTLGVLMAVEPVAAQALGSGDGHRARAALRASLQLSLFLTVPTALLALLGVQLLPLLRIDPAVLPGARDYVLARLPSILPFFLFQAGKTYQQAAHRPRAALEAAVVGNVVHVALCFPLVFGVRALHLPALGGVGSAIATTGSTALMAAWILGPRGRIPEGAADSRREGEIDARVSPRMLGLLCRLGAPIGLTLSAEVGVFALVALLMGRFGGRAVAAHQIAIGLASLSFMGALGVAQATSVRVGTAIGEKVAGGARRRGAVGLLLGVSVMGGSAVAFFVAPHALARLFSPEPAVIDAAATLIRIAAIFQLADGTQVVSAGALRGAADTTFPLVANVAVHWGIGLPLALFLAFHRGLGPPGLWYGLTAGLVGIAVALSLRFVVLTRRDVTALS